MSKKFAVIIGAGPAGLAAGHELVVQGIRPIVLERENKAGGIARTEVYKDYCFDIGGHRFFTKIEGINRLWHEMLGEDFLRVSRLSRIYYNDLFYMYPLSFSNALLNLGPIESILILMSYLRSQIRPNRQEDTFEQWICNRFGQRLYRTFFKIYTEKVWGIPCHQIRAEWAAQRIKGLSLITAVSNALLGLRNAKSLIDEFYYPLKGPGMMWQRFVEMIEAGGGQVRFNSEVARVAHENGRIASVTYVDNGGKVDIPVEHLISSMPINKLITLLDPKVPNEVQEAGHLLSYRSFIIVGLILNKRNLFPDQWIYIHCPNVRVGRIQNFKNWSAAMVPDPSKTSVGMEYFCTQGDEIWTLSDKELRDLASRELSELGLATEKDVIDSYVVRQPNAYPVYDENYRSHLNVIREYLETIENLQTIGRNGMHRYNNMDHSMQTGKLAAKNILAANYDLWEVNEEQEYLEEDKKDKALERINETIITRSFDRMDKLAFASALGLSSGLFFFFLTIWTVIKGGDAAVQSLSLLGQYFVGYTVSSKGAFTAFGYASFWGFLFGWLFAYIRNFLLACYVYRIKKKTELLNLQDFLDHF
jgi:protoporphyrinogen oxidase